MSRTRWLAECETCRTIWRDDMTRVQATAFAKEHSKCGCLVRIEPTPMAIYFQHGELWPKRTEVVAATPDAHSTEGRDG